jgi:hypothetical protein
VKLFNRNEGVGQTWSSLEQVTKSFGQQEWLRTFSSSVQEWLAIYEFHEGEASPQGGKRPHLEPLLGEAAYFCQMDTSSPLLDQSCHIIASIRPLGASGPKLN